MVLLKRIYVLFCAADKPHYENVPFEVPESWEWVTIGDLGEIITGTTPSKTNKEYYNGNYPFFKPTDLEQGVNTIYSADSLTEIGFRLARQLPKYSILVTCIGATIGKTGLIQSEGSCNQQINAIIPHKYVEAKYVYYSCISGFMQEYIKANASATTLPILNKNDFSRLAFPLPPKEEQKRIIDETEKWLSVIDKLEESKDDLSFAIQQAKSKILGLAIHGKLVPQDPNDEPAIELLKRINPDFVPADNSHYGQLPKGWCQCLLSDACDIAMGQSPEGSSINSVGGIEFHQGKIYFGDKYLNHSQTYTISPTKIAEENSVLLCVRAPVGVLNITSRKICIGRGLCSIKPKYNIEPTFWYYFLSSYRPYYETNSTGTTFKAISGNIIKNTPILLPPLAEQERIVEKIIKQFALLDAITVEL